MVKYAKEFLKAKLAEWTEAWILNLRQEHRAGARGLSEQEIADLCGYFRTDLLTTIRVAAVERVPNPSFFASLPAMELPIAWDFGNDPGLSAVDTILMSTQLVRYDHWTSALFHQCVHSQQFQALGVSRMVDRYVKGLFDNGFDFLNLPMERQARDLRLRFDAGLKMFSVEAEVEKALLSGAI